MDGAWIATERRPAWPRARGRAARSPVALLTLAAGR